MKRNPVDGERWRDLRRLESAVDDSLRLVGREGKSRSQGEMLGHLGTVNNMYSGNPMDSELRQAQFTGSQKREQTRPNMHAPRLPVI